MVSCGAEDDSAAAGVAEPKVNFIAPAGSLMVVALLLPTVEVVVETLTEAPPRGPSHATHFVALFSLGTKQTSHFTVLRALDQREFAGAAGNAGALVLVVAFFSSSSLLLDAGAGKGAVAPSGLSHATHFVALLSLGTKHTSHFTVLRALDQREFTAGADVSSPFGAVGDFSSNLAIGIEFAGLTREVNRKELPIPRF